MTIGGSADLTHSNFTITKGMTSIKPGDFSGRYIHYGIREHAHGRGHERHRAAWRLRPLWRHVPRVLGLCQRLDPALGAHGPARALRADARLHRRSARTAPRTSPSSIWRCCAPRRTSTCSAPPTRSRRPRPTRWPLPRSRTPSAFALSRQNLAALRVEPSSENLTAKGAYVLREADGARDVTLLATGSEVELAVERRRAPQGGGHQGRRRLDALLGAVRAADAGLSGEGARHGAHASPSRPPPASAGTAGSRATAPLSA